MRPIPATMATQHPDNAGAPWWKGDAFIATQDEIEELLLLFRELPIDEYMWDWEGKYVDEAVGEKLFSRADDFFRKHPLGEAFRLTYRIPAFDGDAMHRMARAFMNVLSLADLARDIGLPHAPVTELFLPLTTSAEQPLRVRQAFREVAEFHRAVFHRDRAEEDALLGQMDVTPLVEDVASLFSIENILRPYWETLLKEKQNIRTEGQRLFLARSDPAMNAGLVPAVLAVKVALSAASETAQSLGFPLYPILGTGSLPFRGSVNPQYTDVFLRQYGGVRTYSIQSAFRYDYPLEEVRHALEEIRREAPLREVQPVPAADRAKLRELAEMFTSIWQPTIEAIAGTINAVAAHIPSRRERLQHIGLFGYSRGVGKVRLPRAIGFTAALYSLGVPPELIATGRGLLCAKEAGLFDLVERYYPALRDDLTHAGKYLNRENLHILAGEQVAFADIERGVDAVEEALDIELGPRKPRHLIHRNLTSIILQRLRSNASREAIVRDVTEAGVIRRSLG
ncbi:MAG: phosphoenolpyruvate carboxylase [Candidatus Peribacteraceae bacterium]|nr:phosphoenolpyruvate carboxylase [Candidatus Peribacteraceae bacterium]